LKDKVKNIKENVEFFEKNEFTKRVEHFDNLIKKQKEIILNYKRAYNFYIVSMEEINKIFTKKRKADEEPTTDEATMDELTEETCAICFCEYTLPISYLKSCGHYYCKSCFDMYINQEYNNKQCPKCKKLFNKEHILNLNEISDINNSSKIHELLKIIKGERAIIFTQFDEVLNKIEKYLGRNNITSSLLFEYNNEQVLLMSSSYNAEGLNLSEFDNMIIFEPFDDSIYCKEVEKQIIARIHRIGRHKPVNVYRFITEGTIEEDIYNK